MTYNIILSIISMTFFLSYVAFILIKFGVLHSISYSFYKLPKNQQIIFTIALWGFALPIAMMATTPLLFFAGAAICFTGAAPKYMSSTQENKVHIYSAIIGAMLGLVSLIIDFNLWYFVVIATLVTVTTQLYYKDKKFKLRKNHIFWGEVIAFIVIWLGVSYSKIIL